MCVCAYNRKNLSSFSLCDMMSILFSPALGPTTFVASDVMKLVFDLNANANRGIYFISGKSEVAHWFRSLK